MKKKLFSIIMAGVLLFGVTACGGSSTDNKDTSSSTSVVNDCIYGVSEQELIEKTGIDLPAPKDAEDVTYNIIGASDANPIAEMEFTLNGIKAFERAQPTSLTNMAITGEDAPVEDVMNAGSDEDYNISGLYYTWDAAGTTVVQNRDGWSYLCKEAGLITWLDEVPGILYNIGVTEKTDMDTLRQLAETVFVPLQEDSEANASA